jgi:hypothetical protein
MLWLARLALAQLAARRWQWSVADLLWLMVSAAVATTYLLLLR